ncbi:unnamed protein product [Heligmosomoides polygyrus]|uniref:RBR-type E3 ubiquitin transferase n=1 Tax=Heligmosomoides polygyrus TaxID=6339 RepID=A0A183GAF4_HELPZ|nr:unnamed protein product [Heligmosomoides polygyrus]
MSCNFIIHCITRNRDGDADFGQDEGSGERGGDLLLGYEGEDECLELVGLKYVEMEIMENRVEVSCPECAAHLHPSDIRNLVGGRTALIEKYEQFSLRRYLMTECDTRWCPAPDCGYAVIATACAACPQLKCERESCGTLFCYHCKVCEF